jgi:peroxisomal 3,2-trans-enoyl-CoA isomerase
VQCGFVNKIFSSGAPEDSEGVLKLVLGEFEDRLGAHIVPDSILRIKQLIRAPERDPYDSMGVKEVFSGIEIFMSESGRCCSDLMDANHTVEGIPQEQFAAIASGKKRHKL